MKIIYRYILLSLLLLPSLSVKAQVSEIPDLVLDTMTVSKKTFINDYSMIGVQYGAGLSQVIWNPTQDQEMIFMPYNVGITFTRYGKMFGYMPFFGFQIGLFYGQEGYKFKESANGYSTSLLGADKAIFDVVELPFVSHMHIDFWKMKVLAEIGFFAGYRLKIHRFPVNGKYSNDEFASYQYAFHETDRRWDYGIKGGLGFGLVFDPIEIHLKATYKHSMSSLYEPDKDSKYYYKFAYPSNIVISAGLHFQLTKRTGKTKTQLRKEAKELVYGTE